VTFELYIDDSGSRNTNHKPSNPGEKDAFGLGGILIAEEDVEGLKNSHRKVLDRFDLSCPLHSSKIRSKKDGFRWLAKEPEKEQPFYEAINTLTLEMPAYAAACVINRPGYNARYESEFDSNHWPLCKTAYSILVERCAKYAHAHDRRLRVIVERTGKNEDSKIEEYHTNLREQGAPFNADTSMIHQPLTGDELSSILMKKPSFVTKESRLMQIADLTLYPLVRGAYDPDYLPYQHLVKNEKILVIPNGKDDEVISGIKYSCFDD